MGFTSEDTHISVRKSGAFHCPTPFYMDSVKGWTQEGAWRPAYQGALFNLPATEVLNITGLPIGLYTFWFAVDYPMDGILNFNGPILVDWVNVNIQGALGSTNGLRCSAALADAPTGAAP